MLKKDFWYDLPKELIAQEPADPRDAARLMVLDRKNDKILHSVFHELPHYLEKGDLLVVNNSKVLPARLMGTKVPTGLRAAAAPPGQGRYLGVPGPPRQADAAGHEGGVRRRQPDRRGG